MNENSKKRLIDAARCEPVDSTPVWLMRQAGRYLPEYHVTKDKAGGFLELCKNPELGAEVTLQPIRRFGLDGAILFSDILIPAEAMGLELGFDPGPVFSNPVRSDADVAALDIPEPEESLGFSMEILRIVAKELPASTALIGFAGSPYTTACYMIEGKGSSNFETARAFAYKRPDLMLKLLDKVAETTSRYLLAQIAAGAEIVQLFESSAFSLSSSLFEDLALKYAAKVIDSISKTGVPIIYFAPGAMTSLKKISGIGADVVGVDFRVRLGEARDLVGAKTAVQGNLDPAALLGTPEAAIEATRRVLEENARRPGHIFNLGHGVLPTTSIANVEAMVRTIRDHG